MMSYQKFLKESGNRFKQKLKSGVPYDQAEGDAEAEIIEEWIQFGKADSVVSYLLSNYDTGGGDQVIFPVVEKLVNHGFEQLAKRLLKGHLFLKLNSFRVLKTLLDKNGKRWEKESPEGYVTSVNELGFKAKSILAAIDRCKGSALLEESQLVDIRIQLETGCLPKAKPTTDKRKVDEAVFWCLIEESRQRAESTLEVVSLLRENLEAMGVSEIKKFQKHLYQMLADAAHWDLWALAYIALGGCGDDGFEYFRAWLVMQGKDAYELALKDVVAFAKQTEWGEDPQCEEALYVAQEAFENKRLEPMPNVALPKEKLKGNKWDESDLHKRYTIIVELFEG